MASVLLPGAATEAATSTWNGGGGNVNWSTTGNWTGGAPTSAATTDLIFAGTINLGTLGTPLNQDIATPFLLNSLTFSSGGGAFFLGGGALRFDGGASNTITQSSSSAENIANNFTAPSTNTTRTITLAGNGTGLVTLAGVIASGNGQRDYAIVKSGTSTFSLTGANTFGGSTTINGGTLTAAASSGSALGSTSGITVNSGGTLLLGASNQINNSATMTLAGGTFSKGNFSEGTAGAVGVGALTLSASGSHIDFGTGTVGIFTFASLNVSTFTLAIDNWTGNVNTVGSGSTDRLIFDSDQASNLSSFVFTGYGTGGVEFNLGGGFWEVVAAVPEPSTWAMGTLALAALMYRPARRLFVKRY